ncbi:hypothetical protein HDV05_007888 [Chytridiales sp. JEL 0842]|nr:hypothetical protein HDV05_007888 [Chytridiales sp. JEL 0842]
MEHPGRPSPSTDFYELLGVDRKANDEQIKKDKNGSDPVAAEKFQQIQRAYEVLSDEKKRKIYNQYGEQGIAMMDTIPFLDPEIMLGLNKFILVGTIFVILLLLFPIFIALKVDGKISWSWSAVFSPSYIAFSGLIVGLFMLLLKEDPEDEEEDEESQDQETNEDGEPIRNENKKKKKGKSKSLQDIFPKVLTVGYFLLVAIFDVLVALKLDNVITSSWWTVFVPWFLMEVYHFIGGGIMLAFKFSEGVIMMVPPTTFSGEEGPQYTSRPMTGKEKLQAVVDVYLTFALRLAQVILVVTKITSAPDLGWAVVFIPTFLYGAFQLINLILTSAYLRSPEAASAPYSAEKRTANHCNIILFIIFSILFYTAIGLLIRRLSQPIDDGYPPAAVILIPVFIVLGLLVCFVGCCLPCLLCLIKMDLKSGMMMDEEEGGMQQIIPVERRITEA